MKSSVTLRPTMKTIIASIACLFALCGCSTAAPTNGTLVMFPLAQMFGGNNYNKPFRVDAVRPLITDGTNLFVGSFNTVIPTGGTNPITRLTPNDYLVTFQDARTPWRIAVPQSTNVLNALALTVGSLPIFTYNLTGITTATNLSGTALVQVTNISRSLIPTTATNISGAALTQVTNIASSFSGGGTASTNLNWNSITNQPSVVTNGPNASWMGYGMSGFGLILDDLRGVVLTNNNGGQMVLSAGGIQLWSDGISIDLLNREIHGGGGTWEFYDGGAHGDFSGTFTGTGTGLTFTNAAGSRFRVIVNSSTNGFTFVPAP
jgi:hypothetical protein